MEVWYKQNTGIKNPQDRNLDYFVVNLIGANYSTSSCGAEILFYEFLEDAEGGKIAPASRGVYWNPLIDSVSQMQTDLFSFDSITTTSGDVITLLNPTQKDG